VRDATEEQQGRHVLAVDPHAEMQAQLRAVPELRRANELTARHRFAC
jgi:hypothetical protein